jgi:SMC interacting uncharacterized protein involved in chromosome segregation
MRFTDFAITESDMDDVKSDVEELVINKIESNVKSASLDAFVEEVNELGIGISKSMLRLILESPEFQNLIANVSNSEIEFNLPGNVPDEMVPEPEDMENNVSNLATSAANKGIGDELNV